MRPIQETTGFKAQQELAVSTDGSCSKRINEVSEFIVARAFLHLRGLSVVALQSLIRIYTFL